MATAGVERVARRMLFLAARTAMEGRGIVWVLESPELAEDFSRTVVVEDGRTVEDGTWEALSAAGGPLARLLRQS